MGKKGTKDLLISKLRIYSLGQEVSWLKVRFCSQSVVRSKMVFAAHSLVKTEMLSISSLNTPRAPPRQMPQPDSATMDTLTEEMERLVIEARIKTAPIGSELWRARQEITDNVRKRFDEHERATSTPGATPWRRRLTPTRSGVFGESKSPVDVIDVDTWDEHRQRTAEQERASQVQTASSVRQAKTPELERIHSMPGEYRLRSQSV